MISKRADQAWAIQNTWTPNCDSRKGTSPLSRNSHLIDSAATTGVMMNGNSEAVMKTALSRCVAPLTPSASRKPMTSTNGSVTKV